ncbi:RsmB/NOP family class I SAM-dependent RNA methyltransferase [Rhodococcus sp. AB351]|uniref:RsmB/NOP family class I SAM-dependent RNA methyltransferase n=1 Tax=Rhodococcus sp. AB351 TaxID=3413280 RepID=UPI003C24AA54
MSESGRPPRGKRNPGGRNPAGRGGRNGGGKPNRNPASEHTRRPSKPPADPARVAARDVLRAVRERDAYANLVLPSLLRERHLDARDAALATELTYGAARARGLLDAVIADAANRPVDEIDGALLDVLRLGAYQLLRTRVAPHAAVATSVDLVRAEFGAGRAGFVNAVLRRVGERSEEEWITLLAPDADRDPVGHLAFRYAHPLWIAQAFAHALGSDASELSDVLAADDARPIVHLVARPGVITAEELALVTGGEIGPWSPYAVHLEHGDPGRLEPVREGMAAVQDEGSQLVARALTLAPLVGEDRGRWLDLCAGPGGKAALLGAIAAIDGFAVDAVEPVEHRAELVRKTARDLPVTVHVADGREPGLEPGYDRILVDAPCTGLGALRRRPEARWRRQPGDVAELVRLQKELLASAIGLLRPGGVVLYSTCSPHVSETVAVVSDAVRRHGVELLDTRELVPGVPRVGEGPGVQLWPHRHGTDAMFMAALRKPER